MIPAERMNEEDKYSLDFFKDLVFHKTATTFSGEIGIASTMHCFYEIAEEQNRQDVKYFILSESHKFLERSKSKYSIMLTKAIGNTHGDGVIILHYENGNFISQKFWSEEYMNKPIDEYSFGFMDKMGEINL